MTLKIKLFTATATTPKRADPGAIGYDLSADLEHEDSFIVIEPGFRELVPTNVGVNMPEGYFGYVGERSGLGLKQGVQLLGRIVDPSYRGPIGIIMRNSGQVAIKIEHGMRIAQLILIRATVPDVEIVDELDTTERGAGGFGSTGA